MLGCREMEREDINMVKIENAKISKVSITMADHGCLTFYVHLVGVGWEGNLGGYVIGHGQLGWNDDEFKSNSGLGLVALMRIMNVVDVDTWENLKGKYCRVIIDNQTIKGIGNIISDKWFDVDKFFKEHQDKN